MRYGEKNFSIRPIAREGVREGNVGELIKFNEIELTYEFPHLKRG